MTSGLDPDSTRAILDLLTGLRDDLGVTILVITHEMDVVRGIADQVAQLDEGRIVEHGSVTDVVRRSGSALSRSLLPMPPVARAEGRRVWQVRYEGDVPATWLGQAQQALGTEVAVLAALVEDSAGTPVGRLTLGLDPALDSRRVTDVLAGLGLAAEPVVRAVPDARSEEPAA